MISFFEDSEIRKFIIDNREENVPELMLRRPGPKNWPWLEIGSQIEGFQKAKRKLPIFSQHQDIIYPPRISMEQCSSELSATFKADIVKGNRALDLSGGFGIDTIQLSKSFTQIDYVEKELNLCELLNHNSKVLKIDNIRVHNTSAENFLKEIKDEKDFDLVYIDPARRSKSGSKVFRFSDCSPNILELKADIFKVSKQILIKASPLIDIQLAIKELQNVKEVYVLADSRECKEVLFLMEEGNYEECQIHCIQLESKQEFEFNFTIERAIQIEYTEERLYMYLPAPSITKAGAFKSIAKEFKLEGIHPNTHIFTSDKIEKGFPGRVMEIETVEDIHTSFDFGDFGDFGYTIVLRNSLLEKKELIKKLSLKEGVDKFLICYRNKDENVRIAVCRNLSTILLELNTIINE